MVDLLVIAIEVLDIATTWRFVITASLFSVTAYFAMGYVPVGIARVAEFS